MDKLTHKIAALSPGATHFSLEFFPPKTDAGTRNLLPRLERLAKLHPLFVTVTWGAGGSTAAKSLELAEICQCQLGLTTCLHLTCTNMRKAVLDQTLEDCKRLGIRNILALRGDQPRPGEYDILINGQGQGHEQEKEGREEEERVSFEHAVDLVRYIRRKYGSFFCIGVAAYPEGHTDTSYPVSQSPLQDLPHLIEKTKAGADFIMTQLFYDTSAFLSFESLLRNHESGVFKDIPIIPGLMPIQTWQNLKRITKLTCTKIPVNLERKLEACKGDDEAIKAIGVDVMADIVDVIKRENTLKKPRGFHFYTLNLEKVVAQILQRCELIMLSIEDEAADFANGTCIQDASSSPNISLTNDTYHDKNIASGDLPPIKHHRRRSSAATATPRNRLVASRSSSPKSSRTKINLVAPEDEVDIPADKAPLRKNVLATSEGEGSLGRAATWDDFPNGRWGDARSPAYGPINGYGITLNIPPAEAQSLWSYPEKVTDVTSIFRRYLEGDIPATPWSEESLSDETATIKEQLLQMNKRGWWTLASQPAVNGISSNDETFGWGPRNGFVWQKPFVEFFLPSADWTRLKMKLDAQAERYTYFAGNGKGDFASSNEASVNAVTWGAFRGKEIITPTIIEAVSFRAWQEEAFGIWREWQRLYAPDTPSARLLQTLRDDVWLVNVIEQEYTRDAELWKFLLA